MTEALIAKPFLDETQLDPQRVGIYLRIKATDNPENEPASYLDSVTWSPNADPYYRLRQIST